MKNSWFFSHFFMQKLSSEVFAVLKMTRKILIKRQESSGTSLCRDHVKILHFVVRLGRFKGFFVKSTSLGPSHWFAGSTWKNVLNNFIIYVIKKKYSSVKTFHMWFKTHQCGNGQAWNHFQMHEKLVEAVSFYTKVSVHTSCATIYIICSFIRSELICAARHFTNIFYTFA